MHTLQTVLAICLFSGIFGAKILGVFPSSGYSQFILGEKLMTELVNRGHEVTVISAFKPKQEPNNYRTILVDGLIKMTEGNLFLQNEDVIFNNIVNTHHFGHFLSDYILGHHAVQKLIKSNEEFDLVLVEQFFNEAHHAFAAHFGAPLVLFSSIGSSEWNTHLLGHYNLPSVRPLSFTSFTDSMDFLQRVQNTVFVGFNLLYKHFVVYKAHQQLVDKYFPRPLPSLDVLMYNASLMLYNSDITTSEAAVLPRAAIEIGGFHVNEKPNVLPAEIEKFLAGSTHGAILFSLGGNLNSSNLPKGCIEALLRVFRKLKQRILWKFEEENLPDKPENLLISKWLPQSDILAHKNIKLFITHGGLLSTTEAVYRGVPIVGVPVFGDQNMNVARACKNGIGVKLELKQLSDDVAVFDAITSVLENDSFRSNVTKLSKLLRNRPVKSLDLGMFWIEHVIQYKGAPLLRYAGLDLAWYQIYMLDIFTAIGIILVFVCLTVKVLMTRNGKNVKAKMQ